MTIQHNRSHLSGSSSMIYKRPAETGWERASRFFVIVSICGLCWFTLWNCTHSWGIRPGVTLRIEKDGSVNLADLNRLKGQIDGDQYQHGLKKR